MSDEPRVILGVRAHTGWAAAVALAGTAESPVVVDRKRFDLADHSHPRAAGFVYHLAAEQPLAAAGAMVRRTRAAAIERARAELAAWTAAHAGTRSVAAAIVSGMKPPLDLPLAQVLASHARIHAAEGELWREVWAAASESLGFSVERVPEPELVARVADRLRLSVERVAARLAELGRRAGPPWAGDQKLATLAAWAALP